MENRSLYLDIWQEVSAGKNMIFLAGPRQAGKTTLAKGISLDFANRVYFNWDIMEDRTRLIENPAFFTEAGRKDATVPLVILDEIHKYREWKNYLKGVYDRFGEEFRFLVSGSGRLDLYQKGSDSLAGRYFLFHLWPFTIAEVGERRRDITAFLANPLDIDMNEQGRLRELWQRMATVSGFPEPFVSGKENFYRRWSSTYSRQLIREDIRDLTGIKSITEVETLYMLLPSRIGSPISAPSLARDLKVSYNSIQSWLSVFETFFLTFSISPWTAKISRAIQKEKKVYLWDAPRIRNAAARFENMVALELYRAVSSWNDMGLGDFALHFVKNKEQQEVDFLIADGNRPLLLVEAKLAETRPSEALKKYQSVLKIPAVQLFETGDHFKIIPNDRQRILVAPASQWLAALP